MCDFGMSAFWRQTPQPTPTNGVGHGVHGHGHGKTVDTVDPAAPPSGLSVLWAAPELFAASGRATFATDVYAFGVVLWEICSLAQPFGDLRTDMVPAVVLRGANGVVRGATALCAAFFENRDKLSGPITL